MLDIENDHENRNVSALIANDETAKFIFYLTPVTLN